MGDGHAPSVSRRASARGLGALPSRNKARGTARQSTQLSVEHALLADRVAPLGAPSGVLRRRAALLATIAGAPTRSSTRPFAGSRISKRGRAVWPAISQLLAGGHSASERSPDTARARALREHARGRRPEPHEPEQPVRALSWDQATENLSPPGRVGITYFCACKRRAMRGIFARGLWRSKNARQFHRPLRPAAASQPRGGGAASAPDRGSRR
jgi:hypothetical protein